MKRFSPYSIIVHVLLLIFLLMTIWSGNDLYKRALRDKQFLEKYGPNIQEVGNEFNVDVKIETIDDLFNVIQDISEN